MITRCLSGRPRDNRLLTLTFTQVFPTDMTDPIIEKAGGVQASVHAIPLGRMGDDQDMAGLALYLASGAGAYCNGNVITPDGGLLSHLPSTF